MANQIVFKLANTKFIRLTWGFTLGPAETASQCCAN